jgi:hypothetical protein
VPNRFIPPFRRRLVAVIALWLVVLQSFLTGVATAQAGVAMADPLAAAIICHSGGGGGDPADPAVPDAGKVWHLCCSYCMAAAGAAAVSARSRADEGRASSFRSDFIIVIAREAVRAGPSQGLQVRRKRPDRRGRSRCLALPILETAMLRHLIGALGACLLIGPAAAHVTLENR